MSNRGSGSERIRALVSNFDESIANTRTLEASIIAFVPDGHLRQREFACAELRINAHGRQHAHVEGELLDGQFGK